MDDLEITFDDARQPKKAFDDFFGNILGKNLTVRLPKSIPHITIQYQIIHTFSLSSLLHGYSTNGVQKSQSGRSRMSQSSCCRSSELTRLY